MDNLAFPEIVVNPPHMNTERGGSRSGHALARRTARSSGGVALTKGLEIACHRFCQWLGLA